MKYSVIIPVYNVEEYLMECLNSIVLQLDEELRSLVEIILIDDGSTDNSGKICDEFMEKYKDMTIRVFHNNNQGLVMTRRFGYNVCTGDYVINCDSDDLFESDFFYTLEKYLDYSVDLMIFNENRYENGKKSIFFDNIFTCEEYCFVEKSELFHELLSGYRIVSMSCKVYKRKLVNVERDYSEFRRVRNGEDTLQSIELFDNADRVLYINKSLYNYRITNGSMSIGFDENYFDSFKKVFDELNRVGLRWDLTEFDKLYATKICSCIGRAVTQLRFADLNINKRQYLKRLNAESYVVSYLKYVYNVRKMIQKDYFILDILLKFKLYDLIILLLYLKNHLVDRS